MVGADPGELEELGRRMGSAGDRLDAIRGEVGSLLDGAHWSGFDADQFRGEWQHRLSGMVQSAAAALRAGGTTLRTNAQQQRDASGSGGASEPKSLAGLFFDAAGVGMTLVAGRLFRNDVMRYISENTFKSDVARSVAGGIQKADKAIGDFVDSGKVLRFAGDAARWADRIADPFDAIAMPMDAARLSYEYQKDPHSAATLNAQIDVGFDAAEATLGGLAVVTSETGVGPIVFGGLDLVAKGGQLVFDVGTLIDPNLVRDIGDGVGTAAREVAHGAESVGHAAEAVGSAVAGGVRSLAKKFGL